MIDGYQPGRSITQYQVAGRFAIAYLQAATIKNPTKFLYALEFSIKFPNILCRGIRTSFDDGES
jgi:hypothetical protein